MHTETLWRVFYALLVQKISSTSLNRWCFLLQESPPSQWESQHLKQRTQVWPQQRDVPHPLLLGPGVGAENKQVLVHTELIHNWLRNSRKSLLGEFWSFKKHAFWKNLSCLSITAPDWETALRSNVQETTTSPLSFFFFLILKLQIGLQCRIFYRYDIKDIHYATYSRKIIYNWIVSCLCGCYWMTENLHFGSFGFMFACFLRVRVCVRVWGTSVSHLYLAPVIFSKCLLSNKLFFIFCVFFKISAIVKYWFDRMFRP